MRQVVMVRHDMVGARSRSVSISVLLGVCVSDNPVCVCTVRDNGRLLGEAGSLWLGLFRGYGKV